MTDLRLPCRFGSFDPSDPSWVTLAFSADAVPSGEAVCQVVAAWLGIPYEQVRLHDVYENRLVSHRPGAAWATLPRMGAWLEPKPDQPEPTEQRATFVLLRIQWDGALLYDTPNEGTPGGESNV